MLLLKKNYFVKLVPALIYHKIFNYSLRERLDVKNYVTLSHVNLKK